MSVPYNQNAQIITVDVPMTEGAPNLTSLPAAPATVVVSDNPSIAAFVHNSGAREVAAKRLVPGPVGGNVTVTVNGVSSSPYPVAFDGAPVPVVAAVILTDARTGTL